MLLITEMQVTRKIFTPVATNLFCLIHLIELFSLNKIYA